MHRLHNQPTNGHAAGITLPDLPREPAPAEDLDRGQVTPSYLMTTAELAEALRISERSVKRMAAMRSLPGVVKAAGRCGLVGRQSRAGSPRDARRYGIVGEKNGASQPCQAGQAPRLKGQWSLYANPP
jgi:hypothetical protein